MHIHYFQHVEFEGLGGIELWARPLGHKITATKLYLNEPLPPQCNMHLLVIMGGPMNIYEEHLYPWLIEEKSFLRRAIASGVSILGICLGAQLLADVLGGRVFANKHKEIGWFPVKKTTESTSSPLITTLPQKADVFHWHGDTFEIPPGAQGFMASEGCENQAFVYNEKIVGLQFHLETTEAGAKRLIENCNGEIVSARYIQDAATMLARPERFTELNNQLFRFLDNWAELLQKTI